MTIVSDASPRIHLARIDQLSLLERLYGELTIPEAVWNEVVVDGRGQPGAKEIETASWIRVQPATNRELIRALRQELDAGEAEAIALALELRSEFLLMDEYLGRETASYMDVRCVGLIGVLVEAKRKGLIDRIQPLLDTLQHVAGFWIGDALYKRVLQDEGELPGANRAMPA
jgi:predicted nucleic acid-binding protein